MTSVDIPSIQIASRDRTSDKAQQLAHIIVNRLSISLKTTKLVYITVYLPLFGLCTMMQSTHSVKSTMQPRAVRFGHCITKNGEGSTAVGTKGIGKANI